MNNNPITERLRDIVGNEIEDYRSFLDRLNKLLADFQRRENFMLEGRLFVGNSVVWYQRISDNDGRDMGNNGTEIAQPTPDNGVRIIPSVAFSTFAKYDDGDNDA